MNKTIIVLGFIVCLLVGAIGGAAVAVQHLQSGDGGGGVGGAQLVQNSNPIYTNGLRTGGISTAIYQVLDGLGNVAARAITASTGITIGTSGTQITNYVCGSNTSYNPASLAPNATTTQDVTVTGAVAGDLCLASFSAATTSQAFMRSCNFWAAGSSTVTLQNLGGTIDYATGTLKVCAVH